jgi:uncharacterized protein (DUF4415 family)
MVTSRGEKSTIPQNKDPLAGVSYSQPRPPIDSLISDTTKEAEAAPETGKKTEVKPEESSPSPSQQKGKVTVLVSNDLLERLRNAAWWQRKTLATLAEEGLRLVVERLERQHGGPFEPREDDLKTGRPQGTKNAAKAYRSPA